LLALSICKLQHAADSVWTTYSQPQHFTDNAGTIQATL